MKIRSFVEADTDAVIDLWQQCELTRPWNDPRRDIQRKLGVQRELFVVGEAEGQLVATAMAGFDGHRGWVNYLAVVPGRQGLGWGRQMMEYLEAALREQGCPKINIQVRETNARVLSFYEALGYTIDPVVSLGKRLIADE